ncbi:MAG: Murein hydrolase activator EnvC [Calditrichaeota bacterium]|nr:Murein hydrolase activator EnvC [Calditrichota bacterium]
MRIAGRTLAAAAFALAVLFAGRSAAIMRENPRDRLDRLRSEVDSLGAVLATLRENERGLDRRIHALDRQIAARRTLIDELAAEKKRHERELDRQDRRIDEQQAVLARVERRLADTERDMRVLRDQVARRAVALYKQGDTRALAYLLGSAGPNELLRRQVYVRRIREQDKANLNALQAARREHEDALSQRRRTIETLTDARERKAAEVARVRDLVTEATRERDRLADDRSELNSLLAQLKSDRAAVARRIETRKDAMAEVERWIASLERQRTSGGVQELVVATPSARVLVRDVPRFASFAGARGRLPWPVRGRVIAEFGLQRNETTGTVTENPGIDIQAGEGSEVLAVQSGICTRITYVRGFGNTVLLSHEHGYYTVYAHLASVWVGEGERVEAGRVLGTVGRSGGAETPRLHFQVWHKQEKQDPLSWLNS